MLAETLTVGSGQWAGYTHAFTNETADEWVSQDWSSYEGISLWLYGNNSGGVFQWNSPRTATLAPPQTTPNAGATKSLTTSQAGSSSHIPFSEFNRKEIGNGAPNDGLTLEEVRGYSIGGFRLRGHGHEHLLR